MNTLIQRLNQFRNQFSFRSKLIAAGVLVQLGAVALLTWNTTDLINEYLRVQLRESAAQDSLLFNAALSAPMAQRDYATVDAILKESRAVHGITYVIVADTNGRVVGQDGWPADKPAPDATIAQPVIYVDSTGVDKSRYDFMAPISIGDQHLGRLHFGLSGDLIAEARARLLWRTLVVALLGLFIFSLLIGFVAYRLTRPLHALAVASRKIHAGDYDIDLLGGKSASDGLVKASKDEIVILTSEFQHMADEIKRKIEELDIARKKAEIANEAKSDFLAKMSHEIRTPMHGLLGMLDLIRASSLTAVQVENIAVAQRAGESLLDVVNDILDFSQAQASAMKLEIIEYSPAEMARDIVSLFKPILDVTSIAFDLEIENLPERAMGDAGRLRQVLSNLVGNAAKFTDKGVITLRMRAYAVNPNSGSSHRLRVEVEDTGIGIHKHMLEQIFNPFMQGDDSTRRRYGGTGLGLSISSQLVEAMGGTIGVHSTLGLGSLFYFEIPLNIAVAVTDLENHDGIAQHYQSPTPVFDARVLLAEDNAVNQMLAKTQLAKLGCTVEVADNGEEAVKLFCSKKSDNKFDVVLMDCHMPMLDGYQAAQAIRAYEKEHKLKRTPIIAATANVAEGEAERCKNAGMDDYLPKPFNVKQISTALAKWLRFKPA